MDGVQSDFCKLTCGIPQGSILGPLLFSIYINDLPSCNLFSNPRMYADDTTLTSSAEDPYVVEHKLNCDMKSVESWLIANKLTLNVKKQSTCSYGINSNFPKFMTTSVTVRVRNTPLERVVKYKSLGVHNDDSLTWRPHIDAISIVPLKTRQNIYNALVMPSFNYCSPVWGNIGKRFI